MELRIILPVLCLIGFLPVPGNAAGNSTSNSTEFNIVFHIDDTFLDAYSNMTDNSTITLKIKIITGVSAVFSELKNFDKFEIQQFRNGSIVVDGKLFFNGNDTKPIAANLTQMFNNGNFSTFKIITNLTRITEFTATTTALVPSKLATIQVVFKILQDYKATYANLSDPETAELTKNITNAFTPFYRKKFLNFFRMRIQKYSQGSIVADSVFEFDTTNNSSSPNVTEVTQVFNDVITNGNLSFKVDNSSLNVTDVTGSGTTANTSATTQAATTTAGIASFNLTFKLMETFTNDLSNVSTIVAVNLTNRIIAQVEKVFKNIKGYKQSFIRRYSNGSIIVDAGIEYEKASSPTAAQLANALAEGVRNGTVGLTIDPETIVVTDVQTGVTDVFNNNDTKPTVENLTQIFNNGSFTTFKIITNLTSITEFTSTTIAAAITANQTTATATTTALVPSKLATIQVVFKILQDYKATYANLSDPETAELTKNITNAFTPFYRKKFLNFFRMRIQKYSQGSIVADSVFEFDTTNNSSSPNVTEVTQVFNDAITNGNLSFKVDNSSINVTDVTGSGTTANTSATTQAATTTAGIASFNLTFKLMETFTNDLSNVSTIVAVILTNRIIGQVEKVFKNIKGYKQSFIRRYSNGSIIVDAGIEYEKASSPTAAQLANALAEGVRNGTVGLTIDPKTIVVTDVQTGATANKSPVLASVLTAFWMTLASLLLSAVMH